MVQNLRFQLGGVVRCDTLFIALYLPGTDSVRFVYSVDEGMADDSGDDERLVDQAPLSTRIIRERRVVSWGSARRWRRPLPHWIWACTRSRPITICAAHWQIFCTAPDDRPAEARILARPAVL
jgi:hypothetical protein